MNIEFINDLIDRFGIHEHNNIIVNPLTFKSIFYNKEILATYQKLFIQIFEKLPRQELPKYVSHIDRYSRFVRSLIYALNILQMKYSVIQLKHYGKIVSALKIYTAIKI
jgi:hypothetical protein